MHGGGGLSHAVILIQSVQQKNLSAGDFQRPEITARISVFVCHRNVDLSEVVILELIWVDR